jgi:hypothetical protein
LIAIQCWYSYIQLERSQSDILNQSSPAFIERRSQVDKEFDSKRQQMNIRKQLRLQSLERVAVGERECAGMSSVNNRQIYEERATEERTIRENRAKELESRSWGDSLLLEFSIRHLPGLTRLRFNGSSALPEAKGSSEEISVETGGDIEPAEEKIGIERYRRRKEETSPNSDGLECWHDIPVMISQLPKHKISEDMELLFPANTSPAGQA